MTVFDYQGTERQREIARTAMEVRCDFPWHILVPGLQAKTGRTRIPLDWQDLSRYAGTAEQHQGARGHKTADPVVEENGDHAILIEHRHRVLGLAWYSGRVTLEQTLVNEPELAGEVLLSEGAHMHDFFGMTMPQRVAVWNAVHPNNPPLPDDFQIVDGVDLGHGHGWFDVGGYYSWVGEAYMGLFVKAFSDYPVTIPFHHPVTPDAVRKVRELVFPPPAPEPEPEVPEVPAVTYCGFPKSKVFHQDSCWVVRLSPGGCSSPFPNREAAIAARRRPCRICKP